jgi:acetyl esterase/lipase
MYGVAPLGAKGIVEERLPSLQTGGVYRDIFAIRDITYKIADGQVLQLDIAYPKTEAPQGGYPLLVYYHGGAWMGGNRFEGYGFFNDEIKYYTSEGYAVASASYRFVSDTRTIADCVVDAKDAIRFMVKNAGAFKIDPKKIGVYGHSAGGHLALMVALADNDKFIGDDSLKDVSFRIACAVPMSGPTSFIHQEANFEDRPIRPYSEIFFGGRGKDQIERQAALASPSEYVTKNSPPMLVAVGEKDSLVSKNSAVFIEKIAKKAGAPIEILILPNAEHSFENGDHVELLNKRRGFFNKHLKGK